MAEIFFYPFSCAHVLKPTVDGVERGLCLAGRRPMVSSLTAEEVRALGRQSPGILRQTPRYSKFGVCVCARRGQLERCFVPRRVPSSSIESLEAATSFSREIDQQYGVQELQASGRGQKVTVGGVTLAAQLEPGPSTPERLGWREIGPRGSRVGALLATEGTRGHIFLPAWGECGRCCGAPTNCGKEHTGLGPLETRGLISFQSPLRYDTFDSLSLSIPAAVWVSGGSPGLAGCCKVGGAGAKRVARGDALQCSMLACLPPAPQGRPLTLDHCLHHFVSSESVKDVVCDNCTQVWLPFGCLWGCVLRMTFPSPSGLRSSTGLGPLWPRCAGHLFAAAKHSGPGSPISCAPHPKGVL